MATTSNPLINVDFIDQSNHAQPIDTEDIVGFAVDVPFGQVGVPTVLDSEGFRQWAQPAGIPLRVNSSVATALRAFDCGAKYVEVVRVAPQMSSGTSAYPTMQVGLSGSESTYTLSLTPGQAESVTGLSNGTIAFKYPGITLTDSVKFTLSISGNAVQKNGMAPLFVIKLTVIVNDNTTNLETHTVSLTPLVINGVSYYLPDVLNRDSQYLIANSENREPIGSTVPTDDYSKITFTPEEEAFTYGSGVEAVNQEGADAWLEAYKPFADRDLSTATILINSVQGVGSGVPFRASNEDIYSKIQEYANTRMDCVALIGINPSAKIDISEANYEKIQEYFTQYAQVGGIFVGAIAAQEKVTYNNVTVLLDGTATWAGRIVSVAQQLSNRNQLPSYKAYGQVNSVLRGSLPFDKVVSLMDDYGIGSIYRSVTGNYIFNIRSLYIDGNSYFGKLNVSRVTASFLRWMLSDVEQVIHTEVTSDEGQRLAFGSRCNKKLSEMIARGELKNNSYVNVGNDINSDALTNGGECLNIEAELWFKKLTERVKISIIASETTTQVIVE